MKYEDLYKLSEEVIYGFAKDWQQKPYCWLQEIDIQVEFVQRFRNLIPENERYINARHDNEPNNKHIFQRITCEPYVKVNSRSWMHPDIVIWGDVEQGKEVYINSGDYPIDLICELKYSFNEPVSGEEADKKRLLASLESKSCPKLAIQLIFILKHLNSSVTIQKYPLENNRFVVYRLYLP